MQLKSSMPVDDRFRLYNLSAALGMVGEFAHNLTNENMFDSDEGGGMNFGSGLESNLNVFGQGSLDHNVERPVFSHMNADTNGLFGQDSYGHSMKKAGSDGDSILVVPSNPKEVSSAEQHFIPEVDIEESEEKAKEDLKTIKAPKYGFNPQG